MASAAGNIVNYIESYFYPNEQDIKEVWIILEYIKGNTLHNIAKNKLDENQIANVIKECLLAVEDLHAKDIIHRDIHSENFLVGINGEIKLIGILNYFIMETNLKKNSILEIFYLFMKFIIYSSKILIL